MEDRLNPTTRTRLWYISAFFVMDGIVALYVCVTTPPADKLALYAAYFGMVSIVAAGSIAAFLIATRGTTEGLKRQTSRE